MRELRADGAASSPAVKDLAQYLRRVLGRVVRGRGSEHDIDDYLQESLGRILRSLDSFRGEAAFTTWASGIAVRVAFTELRRRKARVEHAQALESLERDLRRKTSSDQEQPDRLLQRRSLVETLEASIATHLSDRQRLAITAELRGIPTVLIAEHLGTNQNALYKLVHDARKRLRRAILDAGYDEAAVRELISGGAS